MPFQPGHEYGGDKRSGKGGLQQKAWLRDLMIDRLKSRTEMIELLDKLIDTDLFKYLEILVKIFPREIEGDLNINFEGKTKEDLAYFADHGHWPGDVS